MNAPALVGDQIENPWNALTMMHAAEMFGSTCWFLNPRELAAEWSSAIPNPAPLPILPLDLVTARYPLLIAFDNTAKAEDVYGFRLPKDSVAALAVGNERRGLSHEIRSAARYALQIPMVSRSINCLNVAAASAVGLYYLSRRGGHKMQTANNPHKNRPDILLAGAGDHVELGSAIRSACAFGWERALVEDRFNLWFGCDRIMRSEGRGAARRGRNPIRLLKAAPTSRYAYQDVLIITSRHSGLPLPQAKLAKGPQQIVVIPDESQMDITKDDWQRFGANVQFVNLDLPTADFVYHYRLVATIAMAEIARQVGRKPPGLRPERQAFRFSYEKALRASLESKGELVYLDDLAEY